MKVMPWLLLVTPTTPFVFQKISQSCPKFFPCTRNIFENQLPPLLGNQEGALPRIFKEKRRFCEVTLSCDLPIKKYSKNDKEEDVLGINRISTNNSAQRVSLKKKYLNQILNGSKTVEGRINSGQFLRFKKEDPINFFCDTTEVRCRILKIVKYSSFREMLLKEGVQKCLADVSNLEQGVRIYDAIPGYCKKAAQFGVLAIHVQLVK